MTQEQEKFPTSMAARLRASTLAHDTNKIMGDDFEKPFYSPADDGGVRLTWTNPDSDAQIIVHCPYNPMMGILLYYERGQDHCLFENIDPDFLVRCLKFLAKT